MASNMFFQRNQASQLFQIKMGQCFSFEKFIHTFAFTKTSVMGRQHMIQEGSKKTLSPKERILCYSGTTEIKWRQEKTKNKNQTEAH